MAFQNVTLQPAGFARAFGRVSHGVPNHFANTACVLRVFGEIEGGGARLKVWRLQLKSLCLVKDARHLALAKLFVDNIGVESVSEILLGTAC